MLTSLKMSQLRFLMCCCFLGVAFWGCAEAPAPPSQAPQQALETYYYIGAKELHLKSQPDPSAPDTTLVRFNDRVQSLNRQGSWFRVRTAAGQEGWANERYLKLHPINDFYVRRWGVRLRKAPEGRAKTLERLRLNDQVRLLEQNGQGWARVTNSRSQKTGWLEMNDLSPEKTVVRRRVRKPGQAGTATPESGAPPEEQPGQPQAPGVLTPAPAQAAPPPQAPAPRKQRPELFEPF
jgi:SH3-like domain-containing protein